MGAAVWLCVSRVCDMLPTLYLHDDHLRTSEWLLWPQTSQQHRQTGQGEGGMFFRGPVILSDKETSSGGCPCLTIGQYQVECLLLDPPLTNITWLQIQMNCNPLLGAREGTTFPGIKRSVPDT